MRKVKILHVISGYGGGISSHIRNIAKKIDTEKVTFDVIGFTDYSEDFNKEIEDTGGRTFTFLKPKKVGFLKFYNHALNIMKKNGPYDVVLCHISGHYSLVFKVMSMQAKVKKFIVHAHKTRYDAADTVFNRLRIKIDQLISRTTSTEMTSCSTEASEFVFGKKSINDEKVIHIPNSIPVEKYMLDFSDDQKKKLKLENDIPLNKTVIGNMSRFNLPKNHKFMVEIIEYMAKKDYNFIWVFIGAGELEEEIINLIEKKKLTNYVRFLGRREDGNVLYQMMDVFVLPSLHEGLPTVIVETQAAGVNAVISDNITKEVDLDLGMVKYVSLEAPFKEWADELIASANDQVPESSIRKNMINNKGFDNSIASQIYEDFLFGRLAKFNIGDIYESNN